MNNERMTTDNTQTEGERREWHFYWFPGAKIPMLQRDGEKVVHTLEWGLKHLNALESTASRGERAVPALRAIDELALLPAFLVGLEGRSDLSETARELIRGFKEGLMKLNMAYAALADFEREKGGGQ